MSTYPPDREPPLEALPPDAPATVEDVRAVRRWLVVVGIWAVAASAIALLALLAGDEDDEPVTRGDAGVERVARAQSDLEDRVNELEQQAEGGGEVDPDDIDKLDERLKQVEEDLGQAREDARQASSQVEEQGSSIEQAEQQLRGLEQRVEELEQNRQQQQP